MNVPFLDVGATYTAIKEELDVAIARAISSGWYILGPEVEAFERDFAAYTGATHAVGVGNGLEALVLGLMALEVGPGDEVIVPSNTYIATWLAVTRVGATIVPVEPDLATYNLDPAKVEAAITPRTKVILPVHLYGLPCDMAAINAVAKAHGVKVLTDAAQAHGATTREGRVGALADVTAWSFYPGKNLGAFGDGGAVTTRDESVADAVRVLRNYGSRVKYHNEVIGMNSRLDPVHAAVLATKLRHLDAWNARRAAIAARYLDAFADLDMVLPHTPRGMTHAWHLFVVRTPQRDALSAHLRAQGVGTLIHYPVPPHLQPAYADLGLERGALPLSERIHDEVLSLPIGPHLTDAQQDVVIAHTRAFFS